MREPLSPVDAAWLHMEEPVNPMTVSAVLWFDPAPDWEGIVTRFEERVVRRYPRFRQRIVDAPRARGGPAWEEDPTFQLAHHVHHVALPAPHDEAALQRFVGDRVSTLLDLRFAPWSLDLVDGFGAGAAIVVRIHHAVADGLALARVLLDLADEPLVDPVRTQRAPEEAHLDLVHRGPAALAALRKLLLSPADPPTGLKGPLGAVKRVAWSAPLSLDAIKAQGRASGATVNDVLVAAVAGAVRSWLLAHGDAAREVRAFIPVDLRGGARPDHHLGNRFGLVYLTLPVTEPDPAARVRRVEERMAAIKHTPEAAVAFGVLATLGVAPGPVEHALIDVFGAKGTLVLTNVRGPDAPIHIAGHRVEGLMVWVPQSGHLGVGVSLFSYAGHVYVGVATDAGLVPDPGALVRRIEGELAAGAASLGQRDGPHAVE